MWLRPHQVCGAQTGFCRDGALHQSLRVDPVITPAYHRVRNTGVIRSDRNPSRSSGSRTVLGFSVTVFRLAGSFQPGPHMRLAGSGRLSCAARSRAISSKLRPSPSSLASKPVKACHRFTATSTYAGGACTRRAFVCRGRSRTSSSCRCPTPWFAYDRRPTGPSRPCAPRTSTARACSDNSRGRSQSFFSPRRDLRSSIKAAASRLACTIPALIPACQT
jgi:hypothetical protein